MKSREANHKASERFKAKGGPLASQANVRVGSLVYIKSEWDKTKPRDRYIVVALQDNVCTLQRLIKSQLRSKQYQLKLTEIIPVVPTTLNRDDHDSNVNCHSEDSDSEYDHDQMEFEVTPAPTDLQNQPRRST